MRTPVAKRTFAEAFRDEERESANTAHRTSHSPIPMNQVKLAVITPLAARLGCSEEDAGEHYDQMLDRLEKHLKDNNLLSSSTEEEREAL